MKYHTFASLHLFLTISPLFFLFTRNNLTQYLRQRHANGITVGFFGHDAEQGKSPYALHRSEDYETKSPSFRVCALVGGSFSSLIASSIFCRLALAVPCQVP